MIRFEAPRFLAFAVAIWIPWRMLVWRRQRGDVAREVLIAGLFVWSLVVVYFTFFPMTIIFYAWRGRFNLVPFASILQLVRETSTGLASYNIGGNLLLLAPLGTFLPLLYRQLQRPWPLLWRVAVISTSIEATQLVTRARAVDIDDVILNTTGVALGYLLYELLTRFAKRTETGRQLLGRLAAPSTREPVLEAAVPIVMTAVVAAAVMLSSIAGQTMSQDGIVGHALSSSAASALVTRSDVEEHAFVMVRIEGAGPERLDLYGYKKVLPGRYTWIMGPSSVQFAGSGFTHGITAFNPTASAPSSAPTIPPLQRRSPTSSVST